MATAYDTANIIIPQGGGYKAGSLYGWNPQDSSLVDLSVVRAGGTATRVNSSGLIESVSANVPRIDWAEGSSCPSLLIEPQRTNLLDQSSALNTWAVGSGGAGSNPVVSADAGTSPDGTANADRVTFSAPASGDRSIINFTGITTVISTVYTGSFYVKAWASGDVGKILVFRHAGAAAYSTVTLTDEWQRVDSVETATGTSTDFAIELRPDNGSSTGTVDALIWGAQFEAGSYESSYIPTAGSTETRNADVIEKTSIASLLGDSEGSVYLEFSPFAVNTGEIVFSVSDGSDVNSVYLQIRGSGSELRARNIISGVLDSDIIGGSVSENTYTKIALRYVTNNYALYQDGSQVGTDTSASTFSDGTLNTFNFSQGGGAAAFYGRIRSLAIYDYAFTNTELGNITA